jgi:hypothetical protein
MEESQRLIGWRREIFRLIRLHVLMPARQAFIIDRVQSSGGVGVAETLNSHCSGTSRAEHVRECYARKIISRFHPLPLLARRGILIGPPITKFRVYSSLIVAK